MCAAGSWCAQCTLAPHIQESTALRHSSGKLSFLFFVYIPGRFKSLPVTLDGRVSLREAYPGHTSDISTSCKMEPFLLSAWIHGSVAAEAYVSVLVLPLISPVPAGS